MSLCQNTDANLSKLAECLGNARGKRLLKFSRHGWLIKDANDKEISRYFKHSAKMKIKTMTKVLHITELFERQASSNLFAGPFVYHNKCATYQGLDIKEGDLAESLETRDILFLRRSENQFSVNRQGIDFLSVKATFLQHPNVKSAVVFPNFIGDRTFLDCANILSEIKDISYADVDLCEELKTLFEMDGEMRRISHAGTLRLYQYQQEVW